MTDYRRLCSQRDELNNRKIKYLSLQDILCVSVTKHNKLLVRLIGTEYGWIANNRDLAEAYIYGIYSVIRAAKEGLIKV